MVLHTERRQFQRRQRRAPQLDLRGQAARHQLDLQVAGQVAGGIERRAVHRQGGGQDAAGEGAARAGTGIDQGQRRGRRAGAEDQLLGGRRVTDGIRLGCAAREQRERGHACGHAGEMMDVH
ncbi:MAG: hypothetical protein DI562_11965 [Stenotrophomonas acidaminiphila]|nr:MAG: hypothetical protein DI562_11965 [Stenotrophomonas acidaminiphila]